MNFEWSKYKRFFAFGCSFTSYTWPTWADVISVEMPDADFFNLGQSGAGNLMITTRIAEANLRFKFNETDLVMVMYASPTREDRYVDGRWLTCGNIYTQNTYDKVWVRRYADERGYLIRDSALLDVSSTYLKSLPCTSYCLLSTPICANAEDWMNKNEHIDIEALYKPRLKDFPLSMLELEFRGSWPNNGLKFTDGHPTTLMYYNYLKKLNLNLSDKAYKFAFDSTEKLLNIEKAEDCVKVFPEQDFRVSEAFRLMY